jgi:hypothetical protein
VRRSSPPSAPPVRSGRLAALFERQDGAGGAILVGTQARLSFVPVTVAIERRTPPCSCSAAVVTACLLLLRLI